MGYVPTAGVPWERRGLALRRRKEGGTPGSRELLLRGRRAAPPPVHQRRVGEGEELVKGGEGEELAEGRRLLVRANLGPAHGQGDEWVGVGGVGSAGSGELRITIRI